MSLRFRLPSVVCRLFVRVVVPLAVACGVAAAGETPKAEPGKAKVQQIVLRDVQGLWGGRDLCLRADGSLDVRVVDPRKGAKAVSQYALKLSDEQVAEVAKLVADRAFFKIEIANRPGVPDEARPTISVRLADGTEKSVAKWANDKHADFDALYAHLLGLCKLATTKGKLVWQGPRGAALKPIDEPLPPLKEQ